MKKAPRGFIALISTIIIAAILLVLMVEVGVASFFARFDSLGQENKRAALGFAESCAHVALLALSTSTDPSAYTTSNQTVDIGTDPRGSLESCVIQSVVHEADDVTVDTYASSGNSFSTVSVQTTLPPITIISWNDSQ